MPSQILIPCEDLNESIEFFTTRLGFRLEMVKPVDDPSTAVVSGHGLLIELQRSRSGRSVEERPADDDPQTTAGNGDRTQRPELSHARNANVRPLISLAENAKWITGRAGMEYRDLIPGRLNGRLAASHIKLSRAGAVPDYVHYHKIGFQMIYCWHGTIRVVYQDQGEPFWLHPGDCVLQPPEIRHRVLESSAGAHVVELTSPASHETWADHDMQLPSPDPLPARDFAGQKFILHRAADSVPQVGEFGDFETHDIGITGASHGAAHVLELRTSKDHSTAHVTPQNEAAYFYFVLSGRLNVAVSDNFQHHLTPGDSITFPQSTSHTLRATANSEILAVVI